MSKIQQALKRIQAERAAQANLAGKQDDRDVTAVLPALDAAAERDEDDKRPAIHAGVTRLHDASATTVMVHHVDVDSLTAAGLLAPESNSARLDNEFRRIKRPLLKNIAGIGGKPDKHANVVMIAAPLPKSGKTFCALNLALSICMERDRQVLLIDADVAKAHLSSEMGLRDHPGLLEVLADPGMDVSSAIVATDLADLRLMPAGKPRAEATELLASLRMQRVIDELASRYSDRVIIFDTPPLLLTTEAQALSAQMGQIVLVVAADDTPHEAVMQAIETLDTTKPVNLILNKVWRTSKLYHYGKEYGYYS